jgi:dihydroorotase
VARSSAQQGRVLINIGRAGILPEGDTMDLKRADVGAARQAIANNRDFIIGVKARLSRDVAGQNDYEVLRRAQEVATSFGLPVMIHMGQTISPFGKVVDLLKRGDIVTHMFAPPPNSIIDDSGHILPEVLAARRRGVWFDVGNGQTGHMRWDTVAAIMKTGFWPDTFSTDWSTNSRETGVIDLPNCMSKLFGYGMTVDEAIQRATLNPARIFPLFNDRGTLNVGAPADGGCSSCGKGISSSSTTTRIKSPATSGSSRTRPCWAANAWCAPSRRGRNWLYMTDGVAYP